MENKDRTTKDRPTFQEEAILKAKVLRGEILILNKDVETLLEYAISKGGKFSKGCTYKRINLDKHPPEPYPYLRNIYAYVGRGPIGPTIYLMVQPLTKKLRTDNRRKPIRINADVLGVLWDIY